MEHIDFVNFEDSDRLSRRLRDVGVDVPRDSLVFMSDDWIVTWELIKRGLGIGLMPEFVGDAEPSVERAPIEMPPITVETWLTIHKELYTTPRLRIVYDLLCDELASE